MLDSRNRLKQTNEQTLAGMAQWIQCWPENQKGRQFNSLSGHMPGLRARSPRGCVWEATIHWCFSPCLYPSLSLSLKIIKPFFKKALPVPEKMGMAGAEMSQQWPLSEKNVSRRCAEDARWAKGWCGIWVAYWGWILLGMWSLSWVSKEIKPCAKHRSDRPSKISLRLILKWLNLFNTRKLQGSWG